MWVIVKASKLKFSRHYIGIRQLISTLAIAILQYGTWIDDVRVNSVRLRDIKGRNGAERSVETIIM